MRTETTANVTCKCGQGILAFGVRDGLYVVDPTVYVCPICKENYKADGISQKILSRFSGPSAPEMAMDINSVKAMVKIIGLPKKTEG